MKCELCHRKKAATVLKRKGPDGQDEELYVCRDCAAKEASDGAQEDMPHASDAEFKFDSEDGAKPPPPLLQNLVEATLGLVSSIADSAKRAGRKCPKCGKTWMELARAGRFGCPECFRYFRKEVIENVAAEEYGHQHVGEKPVYSAKAAPNVRKAELKRSIARAVKRQEFEKAAELRRELDQLEGKGDPS